MDLKKRFFYFFIGITLGVIAVIFMTNERNKNRPEEERISFPYGPDARTLKSIRVKKHRVFSEQAKEALQTHNIDSIRIEYLLHKSDVDFSESITDRTIPCQTYQLNGNLKNMKVSMRIERCDSTATFEKITVKKK